MADGEAGDPPEGSVLGHGPASSDPSRRHQGEHGRCGGERSQQAEEDTCARGEAEHPHRADGREGEGQKSNRVVAAACITGASTSPTAEAASSPPAARDARRVALQSAGRGGPRSPSHGQQKDGQHRRREVDRHAQPAHGTEDQSQADPHLRQRPHGRRRPAKADQEDQPHLASDAGTSRCDGRAPPLRLPARKPAAPGPPGCGCPGASRPPAPPAPQPGPHHPRPRSNARSDKACRSTPGGTLPRRPRPSPPRRSGHRRRYRCARGPSAARPGQQRFGQRIEKSAMPEGPRDEAEPLLGGEAGDAAGPIPGIRASAAVRSLTWRRVPGLKMPSGRSVLTTTTMGSRMPKRRRIARS